MRVGTWIKRWVHWRGHGTGWWQDNAPWLEILFLSSTKSRNYVVCAAEIVAQYVDISSSNLRTASLDSMDLDKPFDRLRFDGNFNYWVKETDFKNWLEARGDSYCFINWYCVNFYGVPHLMRARLFIPVPDWWRASGFHDRCSCQRLSPWRIIQIL